MKHMNEFDPDVDLPPPDERPNYGTITVAELPEGYSEPPFPTEPDRKRRSSSTSWSVTAKFPGRCPDCQEPIAVGDLIYQRKAQRTGDGVAGWLCEICFTETADVEQPQPTMTNVVGRIFLRWLVGKPVSLNRSEVEVLVMGVLDIDAGIVPARRGPTERFPDEDAVPEAAWQSWEQWDVPIEQVVGYMLDSVDFHFACNLRTVSALLVLAHIARSPAGATDTGPVLAARQVLAIVEAREAYGRFQHWDDMITFVARFPRSELPTLPLKPR